MALDLDTSTALRGTSDLRRLLEAVLAAGEHDEADWIEWKSTLDLTRREGCFQVAKAVLGMANRLPERAAMTCGGLGYVIVGAEPGRLVGVDSVDFAKLDQTVESYLGGAEGPPFAPAYVPVQERTVLVVTVEAPKLGDRIAKLRREFPKYDADGNKTGTYANGTVFVRKAARTVPALASDHDALEARLMAAPVSSAELDVSLVGDVPLSWFDGAKAADVVSTWATDRRDRLVSRARATDRRRNPDRYSNEPNLADPNGLQAALASAAQRQADLHQATLDSLGGMFTTEQEDTRTLEEYIAEVEAWQKKLIHAASSAWPGRYTAGHGRLRLHVANLSDRFLCDVQVRAHLDCDRRYGLEKRPERGRLPEPPWPYGKPKPRPDLFGGFSPPVVPSVPALPRVDPLPQRRTWLEDGSIQIVFNVGDLRPQAEDESSGICILLPRRFENDVLPGRWTATARDVHAVLTGSLDLSIAPDPVDLRVLLDAAADAD